MDIPWGRDAPRVFGSADTCITCTKQPHYTSTRLPNPCIRVYCLTMRASRAAACSPSCLHRTTSKGVVYPPCLIHGITTDLFDHSPRWFCLLGSSVWELYYVISGSGGRWDLNRRIHQFDYFYFYFFLFFFFFFFWYEGFGECLAFYPRDLKFWIFLVIFLTNERSKDKEWMIVWIPLNNN